MGWSSVSDFELLIEPRVGVGSGLVLASVVCGDAYFADWERYSLPSWERYASRCGYGLAVLTSSRLPGDANVAWNKFLLPSLVRDELRLGGGTLVLDADQVFSPVAPDLDDAAAAAGYGLIRNASFSSDSQETGKLVSFLRHTAIDENYPLDSMSLMRADDYVSGRLVTMGGRLPVSSGFMLVPSAQTDHLAALTRFGNDPLAGWDGGGGDASIATRELQAVPHQMMDERWQGIWPAMMAQRFAHLYFEAPVPERVAAAALVSSLLTTWCIHFSTSWPEKQYWTVDWMHLWDEYFSVAETAELGEYLRRSVEPRSYGRIFAPDFPMVQ